MKIFIIIFLCFIYLLNFFPPHLLDTMIEESFIGSFMNLVYESCIHSEISGIILFIAILVSLGYLISRCRHTRFGGRISVFVILPLAVWIAVDSYWIYPQLLGLVSLKWIYSIILVVSAIILICLKKDKPNEENSEEISTESQGFTDDNSIEEIYQDTDYPQSIINWIKNTNVSKSCYAVGITGEWGTGKTVFMDAMKHVLSQDKDIIMDFNPWLGMTEKSLVRSFFTSLSSVVTEKIDADLDSPLTEYADAIIAIGGEESLTAKILSWLEIGKDKDSSELKDKISKILTNHGKNIYVFIDDIDRLSGEELFEVLRLIRITADFPHIIYISAYDRAYVESTLTNLGVKRAGQYLEKIFNVEIDIPKSTSAQLTQLFRAELRKMDVSIDNVEIDRMCTIIHRYLISYREIKRFSRKFAHTLSYMNQSIGEDEFNVSDLFHLELLRYCDARQYEKFKNEERYILDYSLDNDGAYRFNLPKGTEKKPLTFRDTDRLIRKLFAVNNTDRRSIAYLNNFQRYFTYNLSETCITHKSLLECLALTDVTQKQTNFNTLVSKAAETNSLLFQITRLQAESVGIDDLKIISSHLLDCYFGKSLKKDEAKRIYINLLLDYTERHTDDTDSYFSWLREFLMNDSLETQQQETFSLLMSIRKQTPDVSDKVRELEISCFRKFLSKARPVPLDMASEKSLLRTIYVNSIDWTTYEYYDPEIGDMIESKHGETPLFDVMMEYFSENPGNGRSEFYERLFCYEQESAYGEYTLEEVPEDVGVNIAINLFGTYPNYKTFYKEAFSDDH